MLFRGGGKGGGGGVGEIISFLLCFSKIKFTHSL